MCKKYIKAHLRMLSTKCLQQSYTCLIYFYKEDLAIPKPTMVDMHKNQIKLSKKKLFIYVCEREKFKVS